MAGRAEKFSGGMISDQKRLVRGEQLLLARSLLRVRDEVHHRNWSVLILAGGNPSGEVHAIRELMPKARIIAVDNNPACLEAAINAGVDDVVECDLADYDRKNTSTGWLVKTPATAIAKHGPFDLVCLDLCAGANAETREIFRTYEQVVSGGGVMITTFSYGRDVIEVFNAAKSAMGTDDLAPFVAANVPSAIIGRLACVFTRAMLHRIHSVMTYRGNEMPMCSALLCKSVSKYLRRNGLSFITLEPGDFELAVTYPDAANLYDCPRERIETLRRKFAAIKASMTRGNRVKASATNGRLFTQRPSIVEIVTHAQD